MRRAAWPSRKFGAGWILIGICLQIVLCVLAAAQSTPINAEPVIIDTDIGDDIDDAFALALALRSPELHILGVTTTFGDTQLRAKLAARLLSEVGHGEIPVVAGNPTPAKGRFTQRRYAEAEAATFPVKAVDFLLAQVRNHPNEITLIAIGPLVNVGEAIAKDPETFRKLRRVVIMGGSVYRGYGDVGYGTPSPPQPEWNILNDISAAQKLFASGVPVYVMPLDSTQLKLDEVKRGYLFRQGTALTNSLAALYYQWGQQTPTLFDPMAVAYAIDPKLCPVTPLHLRVDEKGMTLPESGPPNAQVCLESSPDRFFRFFLDRVAGN